MDSDFIKGAIKIVTSLIIIAAGGKVADEAKKNFDNCKNSNNTQQK